MRPRLSTRPVPGLMKFTMLQTITCSSLLYTVCYGVQKKIFKEIMHFYHMTYGHILAQDPLLWGHEIYDIHRPFLSNQYDILRFYFYAQVTV